VKIKSWKEKHQKEPVSPEVRRARIWIAVAVGIGAGWAMAITTNLVAGIAIGLMFTVFLLIRRGRIQKDGLP